MNREDLELEIEYLIFNVIHNTKNTVGDFISKECAEIFSRACASAILAWQKQREVELLEGLYKEYKKNQSFPDVIQKLINERMVGK